MSLAPIEPKHKDPSQPFPGQPFARPRVATSIHPPSGLTLGKYVYPWNVTRVQNPNSLRDALEHFAVPIPTMANNGSIETTPQGLRYLIEWVYPALRWFCRVYRQEIPQWLQGNGFAEGMSEEILAQTFGPKPLHVREWRQDTQRGHRAN